MPAVGAKQPLRPLWTTSDGETVKLYCGDAVDVLDRLPTKSVHCCVTSPPYFGLRDYGTATWDGGDPDCDHRHDTAHQKQGATSQRAGRSNVEAQRNQNFRDVCGKCGAVRVDRQIGLEQRPDCLAWARGEEPCGGCFVCAMRRVFGAVRRVLRDDGVLWLNLGDSYAGSWGNYGAQNRGNGKQRSKEKGSQAVNPAYDGLESWRPPTSMRMPGITSGSLCGVPWSTALALRSDGWTLRQEMPWVRRSVMPESTMNRPAKALEHWFMFTNGMGYYFDMEAVRIESAELTRPQSEKRRLMRMNRGVVSVNGLGQTGKGVDGGLEPTHVMQTNAVGRNFRNSDLWFESVESPHGVVGVGDELFGIDVNPQGYDGSHFAVFPPNLIEPLIKCSTSEKGCCADCGAPWRRVVETETVGRLRPNGQGTDTRPRNDDGLAAQVAGWLSTRTTGWKPTCSCNADVIPCSVIDPFMGSGTTAVVALRLRRRAVGVDLNPDYVRKHQVTRIRGELNSRLDLRHLDPDRVTQNVKSGRSLLKKGV